VEARRAREIGEVISLWRNRRTNMKHSPRNQFSRYRCGRVVGPYDSFGARVAEVQPEIGIHENLGAWNSKAISQDPKRNTLGRPLESRLEELTYNLSLNKRRLWKAACHPV